MTNKASRYGREIGVEILDIKYTLKKLEHYILTHSVDYVEKDTFDNLLESSTIIAELLKVNPYGS